MHPCLRSTSRNALVVLAAFVVMLGGLACSSDSGEAQPDPTAPDPSLPAGVPLDGKLTFGLDAEVVDLNPLTHVWSAAEEEVARTAIETLAYNGSYGPAGYLAETILPDETSNRWTIQLRPDLVLQDGRPVDAGMVKECLDLMKASPVHAEALSPMATVEATGPLEVVVTASAPWPQFNDLLTTQVGAVADPDWLRSGEGTDPVGTGPFEVAEWVPARKVVVQRVEGHRAAPIQDPVLPSITEITFVPVLDEGARLARLEAGLIDISFTSDPVQIQTALDLVGSAEASPRQVPPDLGVVTAVRLRTDTAPFNDPLAREALTLATDPEGIREALFSNIDPTVMEYPSTPEPAFDAEEAAALAEQISTTLGGPLSFSFLVPNDPQMLAVATSLREQWQAVGIEAQLVVTDAATLAARVALGDNQAVLVDKPATLGIDQGYTPLGETVDEAGDGSGGGSGGGSGPAQPVYFGHTQEGAGRLDIALYRSSIAYFTDPGAAMALGYSGHSQWWGRGS